MEDFVLNIRYKNTHLIMGKYIINNHVLLKIGDIIIQLLKIIFDFLIIIVYKFK